MDWDLEMQEMAETVSDELIFQEWMHEMVYGDLGINDLILDFPEDEDPLV